MQNDVEPRVIRVQAPDADAAQHSMTDQEARRNKTSRDVLEDIVGRPAVPSQG